MINVYKITSRYGQLENFRNRPHSGIDLKMEIGEPIKAVGEGTIRLADYGNLNAGRTVFIDMENGKTLIYGHLNDFTVQNGQHVNVGELIGHAGNTGFSTGSHLHFSVKEGGRYLDPSSYLENIQHMNDANFIAQQATHMKINFFDYMHQHMDLVGGFISSVKLHFIHLLSSTDYSPVIQLLKSIVHFIFLNT